MGLPERYHPADSELRWQATWAREQTYAFAPDDQRPIYAVDTPPPTVSGELHIGHVYSYVQAEAIIRFQRMRGMRVYYPFGFDDNGLPTERYVERSRGIRARDVGRAPFIAACLETSQEVEDRFEAFWRRLGMSVDWRLRYSTIDPRSRTIAQWSFLDLYQRGRIYREQAPNPWCVECQTAIAQAELDDAERETTFHSLRFTLAGGGALEIATTRPELLPACVAIFAHPDDARYRDLIGREAIVPLIGRRVPILGDPAADPAKGSGAAMCCTFGDAADVAWWRAHRLPLIALIARDGTLGPAGGPYAGLTLAEARARILGDLSAAGALGDRRSAQQSVRIHERCKTPVEILETQQWFVRILDLKEQLIEAGRQIAWRPAHMRARYEHWVEHLSWDWCISRQRFFGVPFPAWHCRACGGVVLARPEQLPTDPLSDPPPGPCACGSADLAPDQDVMDTWATSSLTPLIATGFAAGDPQAAPAMLPMQLRPQAHDIIRTWAFCTIVKHQLHFGRVPWETIMISGHALAPDGGSIHKSLGNSPIAPQALIDRHGADAVRYWACGGALGADQPVAEEEMRQGARLCAKLWSAARMLGRWDLRAALAAERPALTPADRALAAWAERALGRAAEQYQRCEYAAARATAARLFWDLLCDNALEWSKGRLYDGDDRERGAALWALGGALRAALLMLAPIMPHIAEEIERELFADQRQPRSIHVASWPAARPELLDPRAERLGEALIAIGAAARRHKTSQRLGMGTRLAALTLDADDPQLAELLALSHAELRSLTRADTIAHAPLAAAHESDMPGLRVALA